jgi:isopentenyl-diphosphate delta-isomerase
MLPLDDEQLVIPAIDANGALFPMGKLEAHRRGQQHLAVSVFVFSGDRLLLQRRALSKYHSGGLWANTCCTHPHWGEPAADCAGRRLREEVGLQVDLRACGIVDYQADVGNGLFENERVHVFRGDLPTPTTVVPFNADEVMEVAWLDASTLRRRVRLAPSRFTPWIRIYLDRWSELALEPAA